MKYLKRVVDLLSYLAEACEAMEGPGGDPRARAARDGAFASPER